jgi:hypothetical protein
VLPQYEVEVHIISNGKWTIIYSRKLGVMAGGEGGMIKGKRKI